MQYFEGGGKLPPALTGFKNNKENRLSANHCIYGLIVVASREFFPIITMKNKFYTKNEVSFRILKSFHIIDKVWELDKNRQHGHGKWWDAAQNEGAGEHPPYNGGGYQVAITQRDHRLNGPVHGDGNGVEAGSFFLE